MSDSEICEFVWQYESRKRWYTYGEKELQVLNKAVKDKEQSVLLSTNPKKELTVKFDKMVQINTATLYEQRIRCLVPSSEYCVWLYQDEYNNWNCYKPLLAFSLEVAFQRKEKTLKFQDHFDFEVNLETLTQVNESTLASCSIKREIVQLKSTPAITCIAELSEPVLKRQCSADVPQAKRICINAALSSANGSVASTDSNINPTPSSTNGVETSTNAAVDYECPEKKDFHIYCEEGTPFTATLNQTNVQNNNNKYYIIQLLEHNTKKLYCVWRRWGRVSYKGQQDLSKYGSSLAEAVKSFQSKFYDKTRNHWSELNDFTHVKGKYDLVHNDFSSEPPQVKPAEPNKNLKSKLPTEIQALLDLICDQNKMEDILREMSYDSNKMPLGKLTPKQIEEGYTALNKIAAILSSTSRDSALIEACNEFYTKIPHNFGMKTPPLIRTQGELEAKLNMLEALSNISVAMGILNLPSSAQEHPLDKYYKNLDCSLVKVDPTSEEYEELQKCLKDTHGPTHTTYTLEIVDAFRCSKSREQSSFIESDNKYLLWHGSRVSNWLGILKQGLRIAPPEAPATGYMFGKGIYFADVCSKSANYCYATKKRNEGLLLLCEVSAGKQFPLTEANEDMPKHLPRDCNSVIGKGRIVPSDFKTGTLSGGAKVPVGPLIEDPAFVGSLYYNEYIVYNVKRVKMNYLMRVKFNFK